MARTRKTLKFLSEAEIIAVNHEVIAKYGGIHGVRELNFLRLAVGRPQMSAGLKDAYPTIYHKAAAMFHSIINNHPFLDGNKRTSLFSSVLFLNYNGLEIKFTKDEAIKFTLRAHNDDWSVEEIAEWIKKHTK